MTYYDLVVMAYLIPFAVIIATNIGFLAAIVINFNKK